jgi:hypothetical protein
MNKNSKDDRVSKKNNYTQQILYDHLNLAERTSLATNPGQPRGVCRCPPFPPVSIHIRGLAYLIGHQLTAYTPLPMHG